MNLQGPQTGTALANWVGYPSTCVWTATNSAGAVVQTTETMTTLAIPAADVTYIHTDGLGSPVARTNSAGALISATRYEPYGMTAGGASPTIGFTGHVNDAETGLTYMQQRYYDPIAGRFLSIDPVTTEEDTGGNFNRYNYANNNPYRYVDPDGRFSEQACKDMAGNCSSYGGKSDEKRAGGLQPNSTAQVAMDMSAAEFEKFADGNKDWQEFKHVKIMFSDGQHSEVDRIYINQATSQAVCIECKTGPNAKYTPTQRNHATDLARGLYFVNGKNFPLAPGFFLQEGYVVRSYVYGVNTLRINRSPATERFTKAGGRLVYRSIPARASGGVIAP